MHRKILTIGVLAIALAATGTASASEQPNTAAALNLPKGYLQINHATCRFAVPEIDFMMAIGPYYGKTRGNAEDARQDVFNGCIRNKVDKAKLGGPGPRGPRGPAGAAGPAGKSGKDALDGYVQVTATGTGPSVTAQCPAGDVVLGGGSPDETTGSYPSSTSSWTINRDHLSPATMTVIATCAIGAPLS